MKARKPSNEPGKHRADTVDFGFSTQAERQEKYYAKRKRARNSPDSFMAYPCLLGCVRFYENFSLATNSIAGTRN